MKRHITFVMGTLTAIGLLLAALHACKKEVVEQGTSGPLAVTGFYPNSGNAGTLVTITGSGFADDLNNNTVTFSGVAGEAVALEEGRLVVRAPEGGQTGNIVLNNGAQSVDVGNYTYQSLSISRVDPANGPAGAHIRIYGTGFSSRLAPASVTINGKEAIVANANDTLLVAEVPAVAGSGPIEVFVDGMSVRGQDFTFQAISSIKPLTGGTGTRVRIQGEGFEALAEDNIVDFNGVRANVLETEAGYLLVEAPAGVETGPLAVTINGQRTIGPVFTWVPLPDITEVTPLSGPGGTEMTITGKYFSDELDENVVLINGIEVAVTSATATGLKLTLPGGTGSGAVEVIVNNQRTEGPQFRDQNLGILGFTPDNGQDNLEVTITGTGFGTTHSANQVTFNGVAAQVISVTENELKVLTPVNVTTGALQVSVDGQVALTSREFRRTGVQTIVTGLPNLYSILVDASNTIYALSGSRIIKVSLDGNITTFAGHATESGNVDGTATEARFNFHSYSSLVQDNQGNFYVSELNSHQIRKITPQGEVSLFASITSPGKMVMSPRNTIIVASGYNFYEVSFSANTNSVSATRIAPSYNGQATRDLDVSHAVDENGRIYFYYQDNDFGLKSIGYIDPSTSEVVPSGWVGSTVRGIDLPVDGVGSQATFMISTGGIVGDFNGNLWIGEGSTSAGNMRVRKVNIASRAVSTVVSFPYLRPGVDGAFYEATLGQHLKSMALAPNGDIYFADVTSLSNNSTTLRRIYFR